MWQLLPREQMLIFLEQSWWISIPSSIIKFKCISYNQADPRLNTCAKSIIVAFCISVTLFLYKFSMSTNLTKIVQRNLIESVLCYNNWMSTILLLISRKKNLIFDNLHKYLWKCYNLHKYIYPNINRIDLLKKVKHVILVSSTNVI